MKDKKKAHNEDKRTLAFNKICAEEGLDKEKFKALVDDYAKSKQEPLSGDVIACLVNKPSILKAREIGERIVSRMKAHFLQILVIIIIN